MGAPSTSSGSIMRQLLYAAMLLVIPMVLLITSLQTITAREKAWYGGGYDPEYAYLFNSLNMARFRLAGHIDHPGTTMQMAGGIVLQGAWMLDRRDKSLTRAVLSDPEHYIRILNVATAVIGSMSLFLLAFYLVRKTGNVWYALLLQLSPFISGFVLFNGFTRITQELMLMIAAYSLATVAIVWYLTSRNTTDRRFIFLFGVISGFGMASKILFVPLMILPLLLFPLWRDRIRFLIISGASFVVFTLPVMKLYPNMLYWIYRLFFHTGQYGTGSKGIINTGVYPDELLNLFRVSPVLSVVFGMSILVLMIFAIMMAMRKHKPCPASFRLLLAVTLAQAAGYLLVAKQPKEAYLLPYESMAAVNAVIILHLCGSLIHAGVMRKIITAAVTFACIILVIPYGIARKEAIYTAERNPLWENAWLAATGSSDRCAVICANPGSSPVAGLYFGNAYSLRRYVSDLQQIYPDYYTFDINTGLITHWGSRKVDLDSLFMAYDGRLIYSGPLTDDRATAEYLGFKTPGWRFDRFYADGYQLMMAPVVTRPDAGPGWRKLIFNGAETAKNDPEKMIHSDGFGFSGVLSYDKSFSGSSSVVATPRNPYAFSIQPDLIHPGDSIVVSVMAWGDPADTRLVLSGEDASLLYLTASPEAHATANQWYLLTLKASVPDTLQGEGVKLYAWNKGHQPAYFDNFRMEIFRPFAKTTTDGPAD